MAIVLDHTIVPAHDKEASARFLARILGLRYEDAVSHFAPLKINDTLTLDFDNDTDFESHHYAFKVDESEFDDIFARIGRHRVWQRAGFARRYAHQSSARRARVLFPGPEWACARGADEIVGAGNAVRARNSAVGVGAGPPQVSTRAIAV